MTDNRPVLNTEVEEIGRYGAAVLKVTADEFFSSGFEPGDIVNTVIGEKSFDMPVGTAYTDVDNHKLIILKIDLDDRMLVALNYNNSFSRDNGIKEGDSVTITMKEKHGYLEEYRLRSISMSGSREDYDSDESFTNFRPVSAGKIIPGRLWRGFSPINPADNRAFYADRLLSKTPVRTAINLDGEDEKKRSSYAGYRDSFYSGLTVVPVMMTFSPGDAAFSENIKTVFRGISENKGPYYIHCRYGRDRTGLVCMILEGLCGASMEEISSDYMKSYENIHFLEKGSEKWLFQREKRLFETYRIFTGEKADPDADGESVSRLMRRVLTGKYGFTEEELCRVCDRLCDRL